MFWNAIVVFVCLVGIHCIVGLFALCVFEIAIVVDVAIRIICCHMRALGYRGSEIRHQSANIM